MGKPLHPAIVHFPIVLLLIAFGLDTLHLFHDTLPEAVLKLGLLPPAEELPRLAYLALSAGVLSSIPAALSGIAQANKVLARLGGVFDASGKVHPKMRAIGLHAIMADTVILTSGWVWWQRRAALAEHARGDSLAERLGLDVAHHDDGRGACGGAEAAKYATEPWIVGLEAVLAAMLVLAADAGGSLTYQYGVGMATARSGGGGKKGQ
jgi:uncharacterized membrane protein